MDPAEPGTPTRAILKLTVNKPVRIESKFRISRANLRIRLPEIVVVPHLEMAKLFQVQNEINGSVIARR